MYMYKIVYSINVFIYIYKYTYIIIQLGLQQQTWDVGTHAGDLPNTIGVQLAREHRTEGQENSWKKYLSCPVPEKTQGP